MKSVLLLVLFASSSALATTCYYPEKPVHTNLPSELCLDSALLVKSRYGTRLQVSGGNLAGNYTGEENASAGDRVVYQLTAKRNLRNEWNSSCGEARVQDLIIRASYGEGVTLEVSPEAIEVSIEEQTTSDVCHSDLDKEIYNYILRR